MIDYPAYYEYLKGRSSLSYLYRRYYLYPRLNRYLYGRTLDVGCGIGDFLRFRPDTVGVDINPLVVGLCRNRGLDVYHISSNVLPFDDSTFDCAILDNVLEHLLQPAGLLTEIRRVLRPCSSLVVGVPGHLGYSVDPDHKFFYDKSTLVATLLRFGFRPKHIFYMPWRSKLLNICMRQYCMYGVFESI